MPNKYLWTKDKVAKRLRECEGDPPTQQQFNEKASISVSAVLDKFDSWYEALEYAGYENANPKYDRAELVKLLIEISEDGDPPNTTEFLNHPDTPTLVPVYREFDSWVDYVEAAGFDAESFVNNKRQYTEEELIDQLHTVAEDVGEVPTYTEFYDHPDTASPGPLEYRFGGWQEALEAAGLVDDQV